MSERTTAGLRVLVIVVMVLILGGGTTSASSRPPKTAQATEVIHLAAQTEARVTPTAVTGAAGYLWMLGTYPCSTGTCPVLMRSTDGGKSFVRVGSPPLAIDSMEFANSKDGYAYDAEASTGATTLYWTGDGGKVWHSALARFRASRPLPVVITRGNAYVLVPKGCSGDGQCRALDLASSAVTSDVWTTRPLPLTLDEVNSEVGLAAFGSKVWLIVAAASANAVLLVSDDGGRSFESLPSRGMSGGLACYATATSATTLWGFCATGSLGYAVRSTDGGRDFATLSGWNRGHRPAAQGGSILPLSNNEAIFQPGGPSMWLTRDNGRHFSAVRFSSLWQSPNYGFSIAFASTTTWLVLGIYEQPGGANLMWRTTNDGRSWEPVKAPSVTTATGGEGTVTGSFVAVGGAAPGSPRPLPGQVTAQNSAGHKFTVAVGKSGRFVLSLPAGVYRLTGRGPMFSVNGVEGTCAADQPVLVRAGKKTLGVEVVCPLK